MISRHLHISKAGRFFSKQCKKDVLEYYDKYKHLVYTIRTTVRPDAVGNMVMALSSTCLFLMQQHNNFHRKYLRPVKTIREFLALKDYPVEHWHWYNFEHKVLQPKGILGEFIIDTRRFAAELYNHCESNNKYHHLYKFNNDGMVDIYNLDNRATLRLIEIRREDTLDD